jgi:ketosteroid isomerase-like protein
MLAFLVLFVFLADQKSDLQAIEELHKRDVAAAKAYDVEALATLWTDDIVSMPPSAQPIVGKKANRDVLAAGEAQAKQVEIVEYSQKWDEVTVAGDYAYEWGTFKSLIKMKTGGATSSAEFKVMRILKRQPDGSWKVHRSIWNEIPPPKAPEAKKP